MQLEEYADSISRRFQEFITNEDYASCLSYLEILSEIGDYEIWSIANPYASQPMNRAMATIEFSDVSQEDYTVWMDQAGCATVSSFARRRLICESTVRVSP